MRSAVDAAGKTRNDCKARFRQPFCKFAGQLDRRRTGVAGTDDGHAWSGGKR